MLAKNIKQGNESEKLFETIVSNDGYYIKKSRNYEDRYLHIDYYVKFKNNVRSVDVKSIKHYNGKLQDKYYYIEIKNNWGNDGWIYSKHTNLFAFQCFDAFRIYRRERLLNYINEKGIDSFMGIKRAKDKSYCILLPREEVSQMVYKTIYI